jgi:CBS domain-containing protein
MPRTDIYLDAMLRHLGAAYYESLHGRAPRTDVARALDAVEEHLKEQAQRARAGGRTSPGHGTDEATQLGGRARRVRDVMTTSVVTVDRITPFKEIAGLLAEHRISGLPVLKMGRRVVGVVTEADLLAAQAQTERRLHSARNRTWRLHRPLHPSLTAGELMTAPAITIGPGAAVSAAARLMNAHHVRRLPVVDSGGELAGIVTRRDLLSVFLRPDEQIAADVRRVLDDLPLAEPASIGVTVRNGIATLTGTLTAVPGYHENLVPLAIRLMRDINGVVDIANRPGEAQPPVQSGQPQEKAAG